MPWKVVKRKNRFCVVNSDTGRQVKGGCHPSRSGAERHKRAIYANYKKPPGEKRKKRK